jgi:hypothetical protein
MEVPAAGMGASGPDRAAPNPIAHQANLPPAGPNRSVTGDSIAVLLGELSQSDLTRVLQVLESSQPGIDDERAAELLRHAADALAQQDIGRALDLVRQFASLDPDRTAALASAPALASIRSEVEQLLTQLTATARLRAERGLADTTQRLETGTLKGASGGEVRPEAFLLVATRLIDAGGLANYVRAADVCSALIDPARWVPEAAVNRPSDRRAMSMQSPISLWIAMGIAGAALCWWLKDDYLPVVCGVWAGILVLLMFARSRLR